MQTERIRNIILVWLGIGLVMVYLQIVIGGITRLTGSGLSITEWDIVTGTLPPLTEAGWIEEFEKYKQTPQYHKINADMEMGGILQTGTFQFIYFWEYLHRLWARTMGFVFLFPFMFFQLRGWMEPGLRKRLGIVVMLAALAATFGWIMVASGLIERPWVNAYKLALHLCIGISVFIALWWAFLRYKYGHHKYSATRVSFETGANAIRPYPNVAQGHGRYLVPLLVLIVIQIFLGGVMSGTKAGLFVNTWPDMQGAFVPNIITDPANWSSTNFNEYEKSGFLVNLIQFLHRNTAYLITLLSIYILLKSDYLRTNSQQAKSYRIFIGILFLQVFLGIITLIKCVGSIPVDWGVYHQGVGVLLLTAYVTHYFFCRFAPEGSKNVK